VYESFYGLTEKPFQLNPDPSFYYGSKEHCRAMAYLEYGLHKNEGFIVITGEVGAGKTTVVRNLLSKLDPNKVVAAQLVTTQLNAEDTLRLVGASFGLRIQGMSKSEVLLSMEAFLVKLSLEGKRGLLIVDEAQNLTPQAMEELRMLSNYQLETQALLQSFLVGQPEFRRMLESPEMQQLRQRVIAGCHISPMDMDETRGYVEHRLAHVGWKGDPKFEPDAYQALFEATEGIPRRINSVCDRLLLSGYLAGKHVFISEDVNDAAREMRQETRAPASLSSASTAPVNGEAALDAAYPLGEALADIDLSKLQLDPDTASKASRSIASLQAGELEERLARVERTNAATMAVLRHLLNAVRAPQSTRKQ
jgi:putative secretion ATPase (PEP-CTERM system associated)